MRKMMQKNRRENPKLSPAGWGYLLPMLGHVETDMKRYMSGVAVEARCNLLVKLDYHHFGKFRVFLPLVILNLPNSSAFQLWIQLN